LRCALSAMSTPGTAIVTGISGQDGAYLEADLRRVDRGVSF
jgi:GDP-D-mannose dehydratase